MGQKYFVPISTCLPTCNQGCRVLLGEGAARCNCDLPVQFLEHSDSDGCGVLSELFGGEQANVTFDRGLLTSRHVNPQACTATVGAG
eukprot:696582-Pyramimonas_sp.AAC.1